MTQANGSVAVSKGTQRGMRLMMASLLVAGAAAVLSVSAFAGPGAGHGMRGGEHSMMMGRMGDRMLDAVNATDAQRAQIKQIMQAARDDLKVQRDANRGLRERSLAIFAAPTVDAAQAESVRQQMIAQHDASSRRMLQAMLDASRVLTPEQRAKLAERVKERAARMQEHMQGRSGDAVRK